MLDLYERESDQAIARLPGTVNPDVGIFDGFLRGAGNAAVRTAIKTVARPVALIGSLGAMAYDRNVETATGLDTIADGTSARDRYFKTMDEIFDSAIDYWTPKPAEVGVAGEVVGQLLGLLPIVIASPSAAVAGTYLDTATDLAKKGVGDWRAQAVGAAQAAGLGAGIWMPILGSTLAQRMLVGGAGFNVLQGITTRGAAETLLKDHPAAKDFQALDGTALTLDVLLGMAFGGISHLSPAQRAQGAKAWEQIRNWADNLQPSEKAAVMVLREAQHLNADSLAGKPVAPTDIDAHVQRTKLAMEQLLRGEQVQVDSLPKPNLEADPGRFVKAWDRALELQKEGERVRVEEDIPASQTEIQRTEGPPASSAERPPPPRGAGEPAGPEAVDPIHAQAEQFATEHPDLPVRVGTETDGKPITRPLKDYLADVKTGVEAARQDAELFSVAAACMLGAN